MNGNNRNSHFQFANRLHLITSRDSHKHKRQVLFYFRFSGAVEGPTVIRSRARVLPFLSPCQLTFPVLHCKSS